MPDEILRNFTFYVEDHSKVNETIETVVNSDADCHFCQQGPITIVYNDCDGKIIVACKEHEEIVREMIEKAKC
jgi:(2Fe-2S) ferredoxin